MVFLYFYFRKTGEMETKILLSLIKDDIFHLQGITGEFRADGLPTPEEVELALFRANALLRQLELLHKSLQIIERPMDLTLPTEELKKEITPVNPLQFSTAETEMEISVMPEEKIPVQSHQEVIEPEHVKEVVEQDFTTDSPIFQENIREETTGESQQMVNELLSQGKSESGYQIIPINNLWDGIGINDRFLFIRELFGNDGTKFELTVNSLNKLANIQEAVDYLKLNFKWHKTEGSKKFLILVKRRFTNF